MIPNNRITLHRQNAAKAFSSARKEREAIIRAKDNNDEKGAELAQLAAEQFEEVGRREQAEAERFEADAGDL